MAFLCHYCREPIDPNGYGVYQAAAGWIERRTQGGANALRPPKKMYQAWAHKHCLDRAAKGHRAGQQSLIE